MNHNLEVILKDRDISTIFHKVLDKIDKQPMNDRKNAISVPINDKFFPELFQGNEAHEKYIEALIEESFFHLTVSKKNQFRAWTDKNAKLKFNPEKETFLRDFYCRAINNNLWEVAIDNCDVTFENELKAILLKRPIRIEGKSDAEVINRFASWSVNIPKNSSAREESARCFWGISKVFDKREDICEYFNFTLLPIILLMHSNSNEIKQILFIENLETFHQATKSSNSIFNGLLIVYASGYKASAKRVRKENGSSVFFTENCLLSNEAKQNILDWLYLKNEKAIEVFFWGDLDYEGMGILDALREQFENIKVWYKGYLPMIEALENNFGHSPYMAGKEKQREVNITLREDNAERAIKELLLSSKAFIDQEFVNISNL